MMPPESVRSRFRKVMAGELPADRLPVIEWASWWTLTIERWQKEGLPTGLDKYAIKAHFHLDMDYQLWLPPKTPTTPAKEAGGERYW
ncbi:MAG: hypothetical protein CL878_02765, partial [Dehalococcoidia bacterium]|nr:hypothetical protein [Dehalococcoidia bacterium]